MRFSSGSKSPRRIAVREIPPPAQPPGRGCRPSPVRRFWLHYRLRDPELDRGEPCPPSGSSTSDGATHFLEAITVMIGSHDLDRRRHLEPFEMCLAKCADALPERLRVFRPDRCNSRSDHLPGNRILLGKHRRILDVIELQQHILDLGRMDFLSAHVNQFRLAPDDANVVSLDLHDILRVEPALLVKW